MITTTDKSGRMAILTKQQYLEAGNCHTIKDRKVLWPEIKQLQKNINNHTWWVSHIVGNCKNTNPQRMIKNIQDYSHQIPEMQILVKDHKQWSEDSKKAIPSRPVLSGNNCINMHLSELISELVEPILTTLGGCEIRSTEEALEKITSLNDMINVNSNWKEVNILDQIAKDNTQVGTEWVSGNNKLSDPDVPDRMKKNNTQSETELDLDDSSLFDPDCSPCTLDNRLVKLLTHLKDNNEQDETVCVGDDNLSSKGDAEIISDVPDNTKRQLKISDFFGISDKQTFDPEMTISTRIENLKMMEKVKRKEWDNLSSFPEKISKGMATSVCWGKRRLLEQELHKLRTGMDSDERDEGKITPPLQDFSSKPVLIGSDVAALYPNLDRFITGAVMFEAVMESTVKFQGIDYDLLAIYLFLIMGESLMIKEGLAECVPRRRDQSNNTRSLAAKYTRDKYNWIIDTSSLSDEIKKKMMARLIQIETITLMSSSCYSFGGVVYIQRVGAGIGERGSACVARTVMTMWDKWWSRGQLNAGLVSPLFIRYVDDIRIYIFPINNGWRWEKNRWKFDGNTLDDLSNENRTKQEICKSFNSIMEGISLTMECEWEFDNHFLPTLDFQTHVRDDYEIEFKFFSKPMGSGLVIQAGTALSQQTVFTSLRQDLVRRLLNISPHIDQEIRLEIIEGYIQSMVNSGHKLPFIKSIVLQGITRYLYMVERSTMQHDRPEYTPLYRARGFKSTERIMRKKVNRYMWYTEKDFKDPYRNVWKFRVRRRGDKVHKHWMNKLTTNNCSKGKEIPITTTMYVPSSCGGKMIKKIQEVEDRLLKESTWRPKLLEKAGVPLANIFRQRFPLSIGCPLAEKCVVCDGDSIKCSPKGVVYEAVCRTCKLKPGADASLTKPCDQNNGFVSIVSGRSEKRGADQTDSAGSRQPQTSKPHSAPTLQNGEQGIDYVCNGGGNNNLGTSGGKLNLKMDVTAVIFGNDDALNKGEGDLNNVVSSAKGIHIESDEQTGDIKWALGTDGKIVPKYIGESSRPFRYRVGEHYNKLDNLREDSFMLNHWMLCHGDSMIPPEFDFKIISCHRDSFSRQLSEALLIEEEGILNKRAEYGVNHLYRLQSNMPEWELNKLKEREAKDRANLVSNLQNFINVITNVKYKCANNELSNNLHPVTCSRSNQKTQKRKMDVEGKENELLQDDQEICSAISKRTRLGGTSTPTPASNNTPMDYRTRSSNTPTSSPIYDLNGTVETIGSSFSDDNTLSPNVMAAGLSPAFKKMFISPGKNTRITEDMAVLEETINLTRAALARGIIHDCHEEVAIKLDMNVLYREIFKRPFLCDMFDNLNLGGSWSYCSVQNEMVLTCRELERKSILHRVQKEKNESTPCQRKFLKHLEEARNVIANEMGSVGYETVSDDTLGKETRENRSQSPCTPFIKKRKFVLEKGSQTGSLTKHTTEMKNSPKLRERFNQTYFVGGRFNDGNPLEMTTTPQDKGKTPRRPGKRVARRLNATTKQLLITSSFSPKSWKKIEDEGEEVKE